METEKCPNCGAELVDGVCPNCGSMEDEEMDDTEMEEDEE